MVNFLSLKFCSCTLVKFHVHIHPTKFVLSQVPPTPTLTSTLSPTQTVLCPANRTESLRGNYDWEERVPTYDVELPCQFGEAVPGGMVRRFCGPGGEWEEPRLLECYADADALFDALFNVSIKSHP